MLKSKMFMAGAALATSLVAGGPASALVIVKYLTGGVGVGGYTFTPTVDLGTFMAEALNETTGACKTNKCTYDSVFKLAGLAMGDTTSLQLAAQAQGPGGQAQNISFDVFSGAPGSAPLSPSSPRFEGASLVNLAPVLSLELGDGKYFVQITAAQVVKSGEVSSGSLTEAVVPEPVSWSLMILGVGALGAVLRRKRLAAAPA